MILHAKIVAEAQADRELARALARYADAGAIAEFGASEPNLGGTLWDLLWAERGRFAATPSWASHNRHVLARDTAEARNRIRALSEDVSENGALAAYRAAGIIT